MSYQLYRNTTLGNTLQESLDELIQVSFFYFVFTFSRTQKKNQTASIIIYFFNIV